MSIDKCLNSLSKDVVLENTVFIELDRENYEQLSLEVNNIVSGNITLVEEKVDDFGKCKVLSFAQGYKVLIALNKDKGKAEDFYVAFKMRII